MPRLASLLTTAALALALGVTPAFAVTASQNGYAGPVAEVEETTQGFAGVTDDTSGPAGGAAGVEASGSPGAGSPGAGAGDGGGALPFTGLDISFMLGIGLMLLGLGLALHRATRAHRSRA